MPWPSLGPARADFVRLSLSLYSGTSPETGEQVMEATTEGSGSSKAKRKGGGAAVPGGHFGPGGLWHRRSQAAAGLDDRRISGGEATWTADSHLRQASLLDRSRDSPLPRSPARGWPAFRWVRDSGVVVKLPIVALPLRSDHHSTLLTSKLPFHVCQTIQSKSSS